MIIEIERFLAEISVFIPRKRIYTDEIRLVAWGADAGFYRMIPQIVIDSENEEEVSCLLAVAHRLDVAVTFRAAGTSLSGQAISESVLIVAGKKWDKYSIAPDAQSIILQPGITGERVNEILRPYGRKFPPDPASVKSAMVGGMVMNNASGANCGTHANCDKMILAARIVFYDGTVLDTADEESRASFLRVKPYFIKEIENLRDRVRKNQELTRRIHHKYSIKNVMGLNIEPFVAYNEPFDILLHLLVGSEGCLAFISQVTMKTEYDFPYRASAMLYFSDIREACRAVVAMKKLKNAAGEWIVKGAELLDSKSLKSVNDTTEEALTAVLTETKATTQRELHQNIAQITVALKSFDTFTPVHFTCNVDEYTKFWAMRSGIFPSVGGMRQQGTTSLIEDVAFHIDDLPEATADLQDLLAQHGYDDACIYGHALEGNYHFIVNQSFETQTEIDRYEKLMKDVVHLVIDKYDGSLKAEHGTGRNMAPFVEYEWGSEAYEIMKAVKKLFDPKGLLNPGVIFNDDPFCYLKNLKPLPQLNAKIDRCIECGFCEINCLTCGLTLSSRQRIVIQREIALLKASGEFPERIRKLQKQYEYAGNQTCAGDGLCALSCPMGINVGDLTRDIRRAAYPPGSAAYAAGKWTAKNFNAVKKILRLMLKLANAVHTALGTKAMIFLTKALHQIFSLPLWNTAMPKSFRFKAAKEVDLQCDTNEKKCNKIKDKVVYFPSCINQTMGLDKASTEKQPLMNEMIALLHKAGYEIIFPQNMDKLCCGNIWESKGMFDIADEKTTELEAALYKACRNGKYPVICDQSPCLFRIRRMIQNMKIYEPVEFINTFLIDKLEFVQTDMPVAVHITCSMKKMGLSDQIIDLAKRCSSNVFVPQEIGCCGFAGDKGFTHPQINEYALRKLRPQIKKAGSKKGYSNSRTCETGLTANSGIHYQSIVYLVNQCTNCKSITDK